MPTAAAQSATAQSFIAKWRKASGSERANYQLFITELCELLDCDKPDPSSEDTHDNAYVFERRVRFAHGDGSDSLGFIDCYKRAHFVLEAKKVKTDGKAFDSAMLRARGQAEQYARALPADEGRPPFVVVVDVGGAVELYSEFSRSGATYTPFPDPQTHRITLDDLADEKIRERLAKVWNEPLSLDPTRASARVTREVALRLAEVAKSLEGKHDAQKVAGFLTRCLFSMFAEDVGLLPKRAFVELLEKHHDDPKTLTRMTQALWQDMDRGGFCAALAHDVLCFNGKLFKNPEALELNRDQIDQLLAAAKANWREVEPAIFGTLLERALNKDERHTLGAHYTPRAYVERLVLPTVIEPLRAEWMDTQAAALLLAEEGKSKEAIAEVHAFHKRLCEVRVLDPACGSGNFLYVTLEHMKRLEGEVLNQLTEFGENQKSLETEGLSVDPHQFLGLELNPRAAAITELVLWIGYLQWHFRTRKAMPAEPVLKDFRNIEQRDAVLAYDRHEILTGKDGKPVMRWDGRSMKPHPVTGKNVPDEIQQIAVWKYIKPRKAKWPEADFIVGNPPFIGAKYIRDALGEGYADALREAWKDVPESADFVMYWWQHAAETVRKGKAQRFGLITTNSLRQTFNRRVIEAQLAAKPALQLTFAIPDHPWVDASDGAAVRISMSVAETVGGNGSQAGLLLTVTNERESGEDAVAVVLSEVRGYINADLTVGADVSGATSLKASEGISSPGVKLHGAGFIVTPDDAIQMGLGKVKGLDQYIREYLNGRDLTDTSRGALVIDLFGLDVDEVRKRFPAVYQWLFERVKPERDAKGHTKDGSAYARLWWLHGKPRTEMRPALAGLKRYIATVVTAKHRVFQFLEHQVLPDDALIAIALDGGMDLGILSSRVHVYWALATGSTLEDRPRYNKSRCFETFPFPAVAGLTPALHKRISKLAEEIDSHRKRVLAEHEDLTLTGLYNVLEALRAGATLTEKEKAIHAQGLVGVLKSLHDELDAAVLAAYGWSDLAPAFTKGALDETTRQTLLARLVALNAERAKEEANGTIRWLRPGYQAPDAAKSMPKQVQTSLGMEDTTPAVAVAPDARRPWPAELAEQMRAVAEVLTASAAALTEADIAAHFSGRGPWKRRLPQIIDTLVALGRARKTGAQIRAV